MIKKEVIPNYYSYVLKCNNLELTDAHKKHFFDCVNKIHRENSQVIYRGDKKDRISFINHNHQQTEPLNPVFLFGAKGRMFFGNDSSGPNELEIMGAARSEFEMIFQMLHNLLNREQPFPAQRRAMTRFENNETEVIRFFRDDNNKIYFTDTLSRLNFRDRIFVRDYYLALLHHISTSDYYSSSFLLSVTTSFKKAQQFAFGNLNADLDASAIIFGWIPRNYFGLLSLPSANFLLKRINMRDLGLPVYKQSFLSGYERKAIT